MTAAPERLSPCVNADGTAKFRWPTRSMARSIARQTPARLGMRSRVYLCFACEGYHVGHWRIDE